VSSRTLRRRSCWNSLVPRSFAKIDVVRRVEPDLAINHLPKHFHGLPVLPAARPRRRQLQHDRVLVTGGFEQVIEPLNFCLEGLPSGW
jgi:hypothetical protein